MPLVEAPNIVSAQFRGLADGQLVMNTMHVDCLTEPTEAMCQSIATAGGTWWVGNVKTIVATNVGLREVYCRSLHEANAPEATYSSGLPSFGTATGDSLPNNVSLAVSLRSGLTGRSARGRWFWYGFVESQVDANTVNSGAMSSIDAAITNLISAIDALGFIPVIVSYRTNKAPRVGGPVYFPISNITIVDNTIDSMRRRLPHRGR
jgi:hypothetical protein